MKSSPFGLSHSTNPNRSLNDASNFKPQSVSAPDHVIQCQQSSSPTKPQNLRFTRVTCPWGEVKTARQLLSEALASDAREGNTGDAVRRSPQKRAIESVESEKPQQFAGDEESGEAPSKRPRFDEEGLPEKPAMDSQAIQPQVAEHEVQLDAVIESSPEELHRLGLEFERLKTEYQFTLFGLRQRINSFFEPLEENKLQEVLHSNGLRRSIELLFNSKEVVKADFVARIREISKQFPEQSVELAKKKGVEERSPTWEEINNYKLGIQLDVVNLLFKIDQAIVDLSERAGSLEAAQLQRFQPKVINGEFFDCLRSRSEFQMLKRNYQLGLATLEQCMNGFSESVAEIEQLVSAEFSISRDTFESFSDVQQRMKDDLENKLNELSEQFPEQLGLFAEKMGVREIRPTWKEINWRKFELQQDINDLLGRVNRTVESMRQKVNE